MIRPTLRIDKLAYLGPDKTPATIAFKAGLNIICGSSETGKSFVVETIDFMLGASTDLRDLPERAGYDRIVMHIAFGANQLFTVQRSMQGGGYLWGAGHRHELQATDEMLKPAHDSERENNLSRRILQHLGLSNHRLRRDKDANTVSFTLRHLAHISLVGEIRIFDSLSPVLTPNKVQNPVDKAAFKFVLTGVDDSALVAVREARDSRARLVANRAALASLIEARQAKLPAADQIEQSRERLNRL
jgi:hypothetical protein